MVKKALNKTPSNNKVAAVAADSLVDSDSKAAAAEDSMICSANFSVEVAVDSISSNTINNNSKRSIYLVKVTCMNSKWAVFQSSLEDKKSGSFFSINQASNNPRI